MSMKCVIANGLLQVAAGVLCSPVKGFKRGVGYETKTMHSAPLS